MMPPCSRSPMGMVGVNGRGGIKSPERRGVNRKTSPATASSAPSSAAAIGTASPRCRASRGGADGGGALAAGPPPAPPATPPPHGPRGGEHGEGGGGGAGRAKVVKRRYPKRKDLQGDPVVIGVRREPLK